MTVRWDIVYLIALMTGRGGRGDCSRIVHDELSTWVVLSHMSISHGLIMRSSHNLRQWTATNNVCCVTINSLAFANVKEKWDRRSCGLTALI